METRVRPVRRRDALSLAALRLQQGREHGHPARPGFLDAHADALLAEWDRHVGWIAEDQDGRAVGCALARRVLDLPSLAAPDRGERWLLEGLFVVADRRDEGWADRLLQAMEDAARQDAIRLVVDDEGG